MWYPSSVFATPDSIYFWLQPQPFLPRSSNPHRPSIAGFPIRDLIDLSARFSALPHNLEALMDLVLRGVVIGVSSVIALFAFFYILSWHEEEMLPEPPGWSTMLVPRCEMYSSWRATDQSKPLSGISTAIPMPSANKAAMEPQSRFRRAHRQKFRSVHFCLFQQHRPFSDLGRCTDLSRTVGPNRTLNRFAIL